MNLYSLSFNIWLTNTICWCRTATHCIVIQSGTGSLPSYSVVLLIQGLPFISQKQILMSTTAVWHRWINWKKAPNQPANKPERWRLISPEYMQHILIITAYKSIQRVFFFPKSILTELTQNIIALKTYLVE